MVSSSPIYLIFVAKKFQSWRARDSEPGAAAAVLDCLPPARWTHRNVCTFLFIVFSVIRVATGAGMGLVLIFSIQRLAKSRIQKINTSPLTALVATLRTPNAMKVKHFSLCRSNVSILSPLTAAVGQLSRAHQLCNSVKLNLT